MEPAEFEQYRNMLEDEDSDDQMEQGDDVGEPTNEQVAGLTPNSLKKYQMKKSLKIVTDKAKRNKSKVQTDGKLT